MKYQILFIVFSFTNFCLAYKGAVLEYNPIKKDTPENTILHNLEQYRYHADRAQANNVDILVFPEYGLTTVVQDPEEYAIDLNDTDGKLLTELVALVEERNLIVVVNLLEKSVEANRKTKYYNTNLVFGRNGTIIAKYRKINLYSEPKLTPGTEVVTFTTDFGVSFGVLTCFDLLFNNPSRTVLNNTDVTDVVVPLAWVSTMPYYTALSIEHGYALATGVNLLAANYDSPAEAHGGSGIFLGDGSVPETYLDVTNSSKLITQTVPQIQQRVDKSACSVMSSRALPGDSLTPNMSAFFTYKEFSPSKYVVSTVNLTYISSSLSLCQDHLCCSLNVTISEGNPSEIFKFIIFKDTLKYNGNSETSFWSCGLLACSNDNINSCGDRVKTTTRFNTISIESNTTQSEDFFTPISLVYTLKTMTPTTYCERTDDTDHRVVRFSTLQAQSEVLAFAILGRSSGMAVQSMGIILMLAYAALRILV